MTLPADPSPPPPHPRRPTPGDRMLTVIALLLVGTIPMLPAIISGHFPRTHEGMRYEHLATFFLDAQRHGILYPRWLPDLVGGFGYPMFVFYQPAVFFVSGAISVVSGYGLIVSMQATAAVFSLLGAFGAFALARQFDLGRVAAIAMTALFMITPYGFLNLYVRGDFSEFAAVMVTPWAMGLLLSALRRMKTAQHGVTARLFGAAIAVALIVFCHPATAMIFVPMTFLIAGVSVLSIDRSLRVRWLASLACVGVIAAAVSSPYWYPVFQNRSFVRMEGVSTGPYDPLQHTIDAWRLTSNLWEYGGSGWKSHNMPPEMSFQLGLPHLLLAIAGIAVGWRRPWVIGAAIFYTFFTFAMTHYADAIWQPGSPLRILQFPWRLLGPISVLQLLLAAAVFSKIAPRRPLVQGGVACACVMLAAVWYHAMFAPSPRLFDFLDGTKGPLTWDRAQTVLDDGVRTIRDLPETFSGKREFLPRWTLPIPANIRANMPMLEAGNVQFAADTSDYRIDAVTTNDAPTRATIQQYYFPGWVVEVNGHALPFEALKPDDIGRITFDLPAGQSHVVAYFDGPPHWRIRSVIALLVGIGATVPLRQLHRRRDTLPEPSLTSAPR